MLKKYKRVLFVAGIAVAGLASAAGTDLFFGEVKVYASNGKTASGEPFREEALAAAHKSLPFGTTLRVVNLENNRQVVLRVNDRIRETGRFILTLTSAAAGRLGVSTGSHARVEVSVLGKTPASPTAVTNPAPPPDIVVPPTDSKPKQTTPAVAGGDYTLQVGAFRRLDNATAFSTLLKSLGHSVRVATGQDGYSRVIVGPYPTRAAAAAAKTALAGEAPAAFIRKKE